MANHSADRRSDVPQGTRLPSRRPLRLWPAIALAVAIVLLRFVVPLVARDAMWFGVPAMIVSIIGSVLAGALIFVWWLFFSRAKWSDRIGFAVVIVAATAAIWPLVDPSISGGFMGRMLPMYAIQVLAVALVLGLIVSHRRSELARRSVVLGAILIGCAILVALRTDGITGDGDALLHWRWTPTAEERLLAATANEPIAPTITPPAPAPAPAPVPAPAPEPAPPSAPRTSDAGAANAATTPSEPVATPAPTVDKATAVRPAALSARAEWPGFRGPHRDGVARGVHIETDWSNAPPVELWRKPVGPGWSSFAVHGDLIYTQEQRGEQELVSCYRLATGEPVWRHGDPIRFYESNGGAGPRGTPTLHDGRVYALGATGMLNALDAMTGAVLWSRNAATDAQVTVPDWGIASSPLVYDDLVIVALSGRLAAYAIANGEPRWFGPTGGAGYSSPHLAVIDGVPQVLLLRGSRTISVSPSDGSLLWEHTWQPGVSIVQPAFADDRDVLVTAGDAMGGLGVRRVAVNRTADGWNVAERWTSRGLKPYFNDMVVHEGHAYGFDGSILAAIDLSTGERTWKGGRYGNGQMVLLPEQDLLFVISEDGELALVSATPDKYTELARTPALNAKTWNHPVIVGDTLLVRNGEEMVAFRLPAATTR